MKTIHTFRLLVVFLLTFLLVSCSLFPATDDAMPNSPPPLAALPTPTPTPTALPGPNPATPPPDRLTGTLEIRFPDPWERPAFCEAAIPYDLILQATTYDLTGEGVFYCHQTITYEEGLKQHLEQDYAVTLSGSKPADSEGILLITLVMDGYQDGYFSDYPQDAPEMITADNPFHVHIDQTLELSFTYEEGACCIWNQAGVFTSLPGEEPPLGENGWAFILHPQP